jgi:hypothetical protein
MNSETTVEIDVLLEFSDYLRANYWFMFHRFKFLFLILFIGAVVYPLLLVSRMASQSPSDNYWGYLIPWGMLALLLGGTYFSAKKHMASNRGLSERIHYVFSEHGIDATAPSSSGHTVWKNIYEAHETKRNFLIFLSKNMMYTIPKRCFDSVEQIASFKRLLRSQLNSKAKWK